MSIFIDTSAIYALLDATDDNHRQARTLWTLSVDQRKRLITSNYVLVETLALIGRRLGMQAVRDFQNDLIPVLHTVFVDKALHRRAVGALLTAGIRDLSLVDCVSFEIMRERGIQTAFAFDAHFVQQGFECLT